jgi:hypothetical protein
MKNTISNNMICITACLLLACMQTSDAVDCFGLTRDEVTTADADNSVGGCTETGQLTTTPAPRCEKIKYGELPYTDTVCSTTWGQYPANPTHEYCYEDTITASWNYVVSTATPTCVYNQGLQKYEFTCLNWVEQAPQPKILNAAYTTDVDPNGNECD